MNKEHIMKSILRIRRHNWGLCTAYDWSVIRYLLYPDGSYKQIGKNCLGEEMAKTHLAVGVTTSIFLTNPTNTKELICSVVGGLLGGVIADVDILDNDYKLDALIGQIIAFLGTTLIFTLDYYLKNYSVIR